MLNEASLLAGCARAQVSPLRGSALLHGGEVRNPALSSSLVSQKIFEQRAGGGPRACNFLDFVGLPLAVVCDSRCGPFSLRLSLTAIWRQPPLQVRAQVQRLVERMLYASQP